MALPTRPQHRRRERLWAIGSTVAVLLVVTLLMRVVFPAGSSRASDEPIEVAPREVEILTFTPGSVPSEVRITGRVRALERVTLASEVQGVVRGGARPFRTGVRFRAGEVLLELDDTEARLDLQAQRSRFLSAVNGTLSTLRLDFPEAYPAWLEFADELEPERALPELPTITDPQLRRFLASRGVMDLYFSVRSAEHRLTRFTLRAPIDGELMDADLAPGTTVQPGVPLATLVGSRVELESFVSLAEVPFLRPGDVVELEALPLGQRLTGRVSRVGSSVDPGTQAVPVFIALEGAATLLPDGIYLEGRVAGQVFENAVALPRELLTRSHEVLVVQDGMAAYRAVEPLQFGPETVVVRGLTEQDQVILLRTGSRALVGMRVEVGTVLDGAP
jgi:membrane fusion protein, multidrug efflux system